MPNDGPDADDPRDGRETDAVDAQTDVTPPLGRHGDAARDDSEGARESRGGAGGARSRVTGRVRSAGTRAAHAARGALLAALAALVLAGVVLRPRAERAWRTCRPYLVRAGVWVRRRTLDPLAARARLELERAEWTLEHEDQEWRVDVDRVRVAKVVAVASVVVLAVVAPFVTLAVVDLGGGAPATQPDVQAVHTTRQAPTTTATVDNTAAGAPTLAATNPTTTAVAADLRGEVLVSEYPDTTTLQVVDASGGLVLNVSDDQHRDGRTLSVPADTLAQYEGHRPDLAHVRNSETGERYSVPVRYAGGQAKIRLKHFSTNTVTFGGRVQITGQHTDGSTHQYELASGENVSEVTANVTGRTAAAFDNVTGIGAGVDTTRSISVGGDLAPTDGQGGDPVLAVTSNGYYREYNPVDDDGDGTAGSTDQYFAGDDLGDGTPAYDFRLEPNQNVTVTTVSFHIAATVGSEYNSNVDIYLVQQAPDTTHGEGTLVYDNWNPSWTTGVQTVQLNQGVTMNAGETWTLEVVSTNSDGDGTQDSLRLSIDGSVSGTWYTRDGNSFSSAGNITVSGDTDVTSLSVKDGQGHSHDFGAIADGATETTRLNLSTASGTLNFTGTGAATIDYTLQMQERTSPKAGGLELNGNWSNFTAPAAGETKSLALDAADLRDGTNRLNISLDDSALSADAPAPVVEVTYHHPATENITVSYDGEAWSERYNVSHTYAGDRQNATHTIPFQGTVHRVKSVEKRVNGSAWQTVAAENITMDGTTLHVELGDVSAGATVDVRTTGRKIKVVNGSLTVERPTMGGHALDTRIRLTSWAPDSHISVANTSSGARIHWTNNTSYTASPYVVFDMDKGQSLYFPDAPDGATLDVHALPIRVSTPGRTRVSVVNHSARKLDVQPAGSTETVTWTVMDAQDGETWVLESITEGKVEDQQEANSPVSLEASDDDELYWIYLDTDGDTSTAESGGGSTGGRQPAPGVYPADPVVHPLIIFAGVLGALAAVVVAEREFGDPTQPAYREPVVYVLAPAIVGVGILMLAPDLIIPYVMQELGPALGDAVRRVGPVMGLALAGAVVVLALRWSKDWTTPDTSVNFNLRNRGK